MSNSTVELSPRERAIIVETAEQAMWRSSWNGTPAQLREQLDMHLYEVGGASATVIGTFPVAFFNRVLGLGIHEPATESLVDELIAIYSQYDVPRSISLSPLAQPSGVADWLTARGFKHTSSHAKVLRGREDPPTIATDLRIERVGPHNAAVFAQVNRHAFGMPDWYEVMAKRLFDQANFHGYIAYDGDTPAGSGLLYVSGDVGGLYSGATLPGYRRRGAQGAIMAQRIRDGIDLGCCWFTTETDVETPDAPNPSYHNMLRTGFELVYERPTYEYQPGD